MNRKSYIGSLMARLDLTFSDFERSKSRSLRFWVVGDLYGIDIFASSSLHSLIWMSQKGVCWLPGFAAVPAVFLVFNLNTMHLQLRQQFFGWKGFMCYNGETTINQKEWHSNHYAMEAAGSGEHVLPVSLFQVSSSYNNVIKEWGNYSNGKHTRNVHWTICSGPFILKAPMGPTKYGLILQVVLK